MATQLFPLFEASTVCPISSALSPISHPEYDHDPCDAYGCMCCIWALCCSKACTARSIDRRDTPRPREFGPNASPANQTDQDPSAPHACDPIMCHEHCCPIGPGHTVQLHGEAADGGWAYSCKVTAALARMALGLGCVVLLLAVRRALRGGHETTSHRSPGAAHNESRDTARRA
jgi:hypothetical protein